ncbi:unnamed protein product [Polarella glacialis]|uniref:Uncharacterized protein n=1 Tax=Polarella glacialis TaxID=89957 RepID=A0A813K7U6_POLGL|nr:unnamed protein product [Polarella glacialis]
MDLCADSPACSGSLLGRDAELRHLLSYIVSEENSINIVTKGRDGGISNFVFSLPSFVRSVQSFLADKRLPVLRLEGDRGAGKSVLLSALAARAAEFPGLRVLLHSSAAIALLRRLHDGIDEATDDELRLMPVVSQAGRQGGLVLLLDEVVGTSWLPFPLPYGVRCVMVCSTDKGSTGSPDAFRSFCLPVLADSAASQLQQRLGLDIGLASPAARNPLWLELAATLPRQTGPFPEDLSDLVKEVLILAETKVGELAVRESLCALACSRAGLQVAEIDALLATHIPDHNGQTWSLVAAHLATLICTDSAGVHLKTILIRAVDQRYLQAADLRSLWHSRLADFFLSQAERCSEAPYHFAAIGDKSRLLSAITDWRAFSTLERERVSDLVEHCRSAGGYNLVRDALLRLEQPSGPDGLERRITIGRFLSQVGEFSAAKEILLAAKRDALVSEDKVGLGRVCTLIAENEVRYWDSLRNWSSVAALADLLDAASTAVGVFRTLRLSDDRVWARVEYAKALTRWANGCFKAACVCEGEEADKFLHDADEAVESVEKLFQGSPPSRVVGRALLVGGVAKLVRGHSEKRAGVRPFRDTLVEAAEMFLRAERILVLAVGEVNEGSIYTHANLAEFFLNDVGNVACALVCNLKSCLVGIRLWGPRHPNVARKLSEFCSLLRQLGLANFTDLVLEGDVDMLDEMLRVFNRNRPLEFDLQLWAEEESEITAPAQLWEAEDNDN